jgi:hemerythrin superfamily protein
LFFAFPSPDAEEVAMNAIDMLERQHREVEDLFIELSEVEGADKEPLFVQIADKLAIHATIEERHFYPAVKERRTEEMVLEAVEEHLAMKRILADLLATDVDDRSFDAKIKVLQDEVEHHVAEEEGLLFPQALQLMDDRELEAIGLAMAATEEELIEEGNPRQRVPAETDQPAEI